MPNFDIKRSSRKCSQTGQVIPPGEVIISALVDVDGEAERLDFSAEAWESPPDGCIGWWKSKVPDLSKGKVYWAPPEILISYFEHLLDQEDKHDTTYITALVLIQRKVLVVDDNSLEEGEEAILPLRNKKNKQQYTVNVVSDIPKPRIVEIQNELNERLFTDDPNMNEPGEDS